MEEQLCALFVISGFAVFCPLVSASILDVRVKPGDNITVVCDSACPTGVYTVWYHISQQNQPTLVLKFRSANDAKSFPRFKLLKNTKSKCYNLHITNITESDEGLYFCGTETTEVVEVEKIDQKFMYNFGNATARILTKSTDEHDGQNAVKTVPWSVWLMPPAALLCCNICLILLYHFCSNKDFHLRQGLQTTACQFADSIYTTQVVFSTKDTKTQ